MYFRDHWHFVALKSRWIYLAFDDYFHFRFQCRAKQKIGWSIWNVSCIYAIVFLNFCHRQIDKQPLLADAYEITIQLELKI